MKVGDLVRHKTRHEHIGIVAELGFRDILVAWMDGDTSWAYKSQMEVINESR
jgi:hypothetical protein